MLCTRAFPFAATAVIVGSSLGWQAAPPASPASPALPPPQASRGAPRVELTPVEVAPPLVDFGVVAPGTKHQATFILKNIGKQAVKVATATPSCKCTDISVIVGKSIPAGGELTFTANLSVPLTPGEKDAKVFVTFENYKRVVICNMKGMVSLPILTEPAYVDALKGKSSGKVKLASADGKPFKIVSAYGKPVVPVDDKGQAIGPDGAAVQFVPWSIAEIRPGTLQQWWVIETDRADCPLVPLRVRHESTGGLFDPAMHQRWWFPPESIVLAGRIKAGQPVQLKTTIEYSNKADEGRMTHPEWGDVKAVRVPGGEATVELVSATKREVTFVDLVLNFTASATQRGVVYIPVEIETATGRGLIYVSAVVEP